MESWRKVFRKGFAPQFSDEHLQSLLTALRTDDPRLLQGATTSPPPLQCVQDWPVEAACGISWLAWQGGDGLEMVGEVEDAFAQACYLADQALSEAAMSRWFLNFFDDTPRPEMRRLLSEEIETVLAFRKANQPQTQESVS